MEPHRLTPFSFTIDGHLSKAIEIVRNIEKSKNFTVYPWEGCEELYFNFFKTFDRIRQLESETSFQKRELDDLLLVLKERAEEGKLTYSDMSLIFVALSEYNKDRDYTEVFDKFKECRLMKDDTVSIIAEIGIYGMNTFLYLFFNGLCPIGIGFTEYTAHFEKLEFYIRIRHDFNHCGIAYESRYKEELLKGYYLQIFERYQEIDYDKARGFIFLLFGYIHEGLGFPNSIEFDNYCDFFFIFDEIPRYCSENLGFDFGERVNGKHDCYALIGNDNEDLIEILSTVEDHCVTSYVGMAVDKIKEDFTEFIPEHTLWDRY